MSKIARIRILNLNYNNNTIKIDDEMFDFNGQNTLISLRNGGVKRACRIIGNDDEFFMFAGGKFAFKRIRQDCRGI